MPPCSQLRFCHILYKDCVCDISSDFFCATVLLCLEDTVFLYSLFICGSYIVSVPSAGMIPGPWEEER